MSSRRKQHRSDQYPTGWTKWEWNEQHQRNVRARELSRGEWEYEYAQAQTANNQGLEPTLWTPRDPGDLPSINEQDQQYEEQPPDNYRTDSLVNEITQGLSDTKLDDPLDGSKRRSKSKGREDRKEKYWNFSTVRDQGVNPGYGGQSQSERAQSQTEKSYQPSYYNSQSGNTQHYAGYDSQDQQNQSGDYQTDILPPLYEDQSNTSYQQPPSEYGSFNAASMSSHQSQSSSFIGPPQTRRVFTRDPNRTKDRLDSRFQVQKSKEFYFGRVFKVLWSEPVGSGGTEITQQPAKYGEKAFHKVRRFVVMRPNKGHSICIPILTYGYQGLLKRGVHPEDHTVVYSSKTDGPYYLQGEEKLVSKKPIRFDMKDPSEKLDRLSRLNYAKTYTVEHNVKVYFIGWVGRNYEYEVANCFNEANPPVAPGASGRGSDRPEDALFSHTQGDDPIYPGAMAIPQAASSGWNRDIDQSYTSSYSVPNVYPPSGSQSFPLSYSANPQIPPSGQQGPSSGEPYHDPTYGDDIYDP